MQISNFPLYLIEIPIHKPLKKKTKHKIDGLLFVKVLLKKKTVQREEISFTTLIAFNIK